MVDDYVFKFGGLDFDILSVRQDKCKNISEDVRTTIILTSVMSVYALSSYIFE